VAEYIDKTIGDYHILESIAAGGMGQVYLVENVHHKKRYALKILPDELGQDANFRKRFFDEARVMSELNHPGIVRVHHMGEHEGIYYLVMDYVEGPHGKPCSLHTKLAQSPNRRLDQEAALACVSEICLALGYAHQRGIVHRDIKPANILMNQDGQFQITDFGLAKAIGTEFIMSQVHSTMASLGDQPTIAENARRAVGSDAESSRRSSGATGILGTYDYMSPEQREPGAVVDQRSDIYSLGLMIYRILTGKRLMGMAKPPSRMVQGLSPVWDKIVETCLEENPSERYQDVNALFQDLNPLLTPIAQKSVNLVPQKQAGQTDNPAYTIAGDKAASTENVQHASKGKHAVFAVIALVLVFFVVAKVIQKKTGKSIIPTYIKSPESRSQQPSPKPTSSQAARDSSPTSGVNWQVPALGLELAYVAPGSFQMGSNDENDKEKPVHTVRISQGYWMGKHEVTQQQYQSIMGSNPSYCKGARNPVENVSWNDSVLFCKKLTDQERGAGRLPGGFEYRLPTEAEWEYAARGGSSGHSTEYAGSNSSDDVAWHGGNSESKTHPVGQKLVNELGLYDMSGNVWEWCHDWYGDYSSGSQTDPAGPGAGSSRVHRSGSWIIKASYSRVVHREYVSPTTGLNDLGFRVALASPVQ
jgi:serine/threonine protein kinase